MDDQGYDNKELLRDAFGIGDRPLYPPNPDDHFTVDGVEFVCDYRDGSEETRFYLVKDPRFVAGFRSLCEAHRGATIVELGIAEGGSTALLALLARPSKLVALDLEPGPVPGLRDLIAHRGLGDRIRPHFGVDQADRATVAQIVDDELDGAPLDLVIDDASHQVEATRTSFEVLFPRLRPGGLYVIEDWNHDHAFRDHILTEIRNGPPEERAKLLRAGNARKDDATPAPRPLLDLALELFLVRASEAQQLVAELTLGQFSLTVRRGPAPLDPTTFRLSEAYSDFFGYLGGRP